MRYQEKGFSRVFMACTGTNTQKLIDLLETMFGDQDEPDLEGLESETMKEMWEEATTAEKANIAVTAGPIPSGSVTHMVVTSLPVPLEFGLQPKCVPRPNRSRSLARRILPKGITKFYLCMSQVPTLISEQTKHVHPCPTMLQH